MASSSQLFAAANSDPAPGPVYIRPELTSGGSMAKSIVSELLSWGRTGLMRQELAAHRMRLRQEWKFFVDEAALPTGAGGGIHPVRLGWLP